VAVVVALVVQVLRLLEEQVVVEVLVNLIQLPMELLQFTTQVAEVEVVLVDQQVCKPKVVVAKE